MKISKLLKKKNKKKALLPPSTNATSQDPQITTPPISPGRKNVQFVTKTNYNGQPILEDDDISAVTPATALPESPRRNNPVSLLLGERDDDSSSQDLFVFEDKTDDNSSYGGSSSQRLTATTGFGGGKRSASTSPSSSGKLKVSFSDDAKNYEFEDNYHKSSISSSIKNQTKEDTASSTKKNSNTVANLVKRRTSILTKTSYFKNAVNSAFDSVDVDNSGGVTLEELYAGLLLIHLKMAIYVGAPACRPASKKYVSEVFHIVDTDNSGTLDRQEFATVMQILYSQVFTRIVIQWTLTLILVPVTTKHIIKYTTLFLFALHEFWKDIDDDLDPLQRLLWKLWESWLYYSPEALDQVGAICWLIFCKIPWKSMPPVMLTVAQTSVALPWALNHVEDFFRRAAHSLVRGEHISSG